MKVSASITLTSLNDAPSYSLRLTMTGTPGGTVTATLYKDGALYTGPAYLSARAYDGSSWKASSLTGALSNGSRSYAYSNAKAYDVCVYTDSSLTELMCTGYASYGTTGEKGDKGDTGATGAKGDKGDTGAAGNSIHARYSDDNYTFTGNSGRDEGGFIGICLASSATAPTSFSSYIWSRLSPSVGRNRWRADIYTRTQISGSGAVMLSDLENETFVRSILIDDNRTTAWGYGDVFLAKVETFVYCIDSFTLNTTAKSDDGSTLYLNGILVATLASGTAQSVSLNFKKGWNDVCFAFNENGGSEYAYLGTALHSNEHVKFMTAYEDDRDCLGEKGEDSGRYFGALENAPTEDVKDGDYYFDNSTGYPKVRKDSVWITLTKEDDVEWGKKVMTILGDTGDDLPADSSLYKWCSNFASKNGFIEALETKQLNLMDGGAIHSGCYDKYGNRIGSGTEGFFLGSDGKMVTRSMTVYDATILSRDDDGVSVLSTRKSSGTVVTKSLSAGADRYLVSELSGTSSKAWTSGTNSYQGTSYEKIAVNTGNAEVYATWGEGTKPTDLATEANSDRYFYIYSNKSSLTETASRKGLVAGGFRGTLTIVWQMQTLALSSSKDTRCVICTSEDGGASWSEFFSTGWKQANIIRSGDDDGDDYYEVGSYGYTTTIDVTPSTIIRFDFYRTDTYMASYPIGNRTISGYGGAKTTYVAISAITMKKAVDPNSVGFANASIYPVCVALSDCLLHSSYPMTVLGKASSSYLNYVSGSRIVSTVRNSLGVNYAGKVENASFKDTSSHSFDYMASSSAMLVMDQWTISTGTIVQVSDHTFTVTFTTTKTASGIEIGALYCDSFIGMIQFFMRKTAPSGWVLCAGGVLAKTSYPKLWNVINDAFGSDSSKSVADSVMTTGSFANDGVFVSPNYVRVPNLVNYGSITEHGRFLVGGNNVSTVLDSQNLSHSHVINVSNNGNPDGWGDRSTASNRQWWHTGYNDTESQYNTIPSTRASGGSEARPASLVALPCIYVGE